MYTFNEDEYVKEVSEYIISTYNQHYAGKYQATDMIIDAGHGTGFNIGNIMKYAKRYGKKNGYNRKDLLKIIHYAIIQLYVHDQEEHEREYLSLPDDYTLSGSNVLMSTKTGEKVSDLPDGEVNRVTKILLNEYKKSGWNNGNKN